MQKAKGTAAARKHASEALKAFFSDPENRRKRSIAMTGQFLIISFFILFCVGRLAYSLLATWWPKNQCELENVMTREILDLLCEEPIIKVVASARNANFSLT